MKIRLILLSIFVFLFLSACGGSEAEIAELKTEVVSTYADIVFANYEDSLTTAQDLNAAIEAFVANPSEDTHQAAKDAWLAAREPYGQTEAFRFASGPIDDEDGPEGLLNAWPLDEGYIDYVEGVADSGIVNNVADYPEINAALLESLNEVGAEENVSTGYHAIEFLLWGQDLSDDGSGARSYTDYTTADNADRRGQYLVAASELLLVHLQSMVDEWDPNSSGNYRASFLDQEADVSITQMLTGIGILSKSELAGERMFVAYDNQDQEDEHSCFSDNTHRDIITNAQGIFNVYNGSYTRVDGSVVSGASIADLIAASDEALADDMKALADTALASTMDIHTPFDLAISEADFRPTVIDSVNALQDQGDKFAEVASILGLTISTDLPE